MKGTFWGTFMLITLLALTAVYFTPDLESNVLTDIQMRFLQGRTVQSYSNCQATSGCPTQPCTNSSSVSQAPASGYQKCKQDMIYLTYHHKCDDDSGTQNQCHITVWSNNCTTVDSSWFTTDTACSSWYE